MALARISSARPANNRGSVLQLHPTLALVRNSGSALRRGNYPWLLTAMSLGPAKSPIAENGVGRFQDDYQTGAMS